MNDRRRKQTLTPIPSGDWSGLVRNMTRISDATIRTEESVKVMKDEMLPPVKEAASEARDGVLQLGIRVENLERSPHNCIEGERAFLNKEKPEEQSRSSSNPYISCS